MVAEFAVTFIRFVAIGLELLILARVILSWLDPSGRGPFATFVVGATEPILAPIRRALPRTGMLDLSPFIVILVLSMLLRIVT